jgi:hypothetical protein
MEDDISETDGGRPQGMMDDYVLDDDDSPLMMPRHERPVCQMNASHPAPDARRVRRPSPGNAGCHCQDVMDESCREASCPGSGNHTLLPLE